MAKPARSTESFGQGQSGYAAGRTESDRSYSSRNQGYARDGSPNDWDKQASTDDQVAARARDALAHDARVDASGIRVTVSNGEVTLAGTVASRDMRGFAEASVAQLRGVASVNNELIAIA